MSIEVDSLSLKIITEGAQASSALTGLASALEKLANKASQIKSANAELQTLRNTLESFNKVDSSRLVELSDSLQRIGLFKVPKLKSLASELNSLKNIKIDAVAVKIHELGEAMGQLAAYAGNTHLASMLSDLAKISANSARAASALRQTADAAREVQQAQGTATPSGDVKPHVDTEQTERSTSAFQRLRQALSGVLDRMGRFGSNAATSAVRKLGSAASSAVHPVKTLKNTLAKIPVVSKALGMLTSFLKLAKFRVMRMALTAIFNGINQSFKSLYQYGGQFASSMDSITTSTKYLSNSIVAALAPAINALAPIIDGAVDKFVSFLNIINQIIATITGASSWTKAVKVPQKYDDSLSSATSSAKELKRTLLSFDEVNRLDSQSSASGGSSGSGVDSSMMFETQEVSSSLSDLKRKLEEFLGVDLSPMLSSLGRLKESAKNLSDVIAGGLKWGYENVLKPLGKWTIEKGLPAVIGALAGSMDFLAAALELALPSLKWLWNHGISKSFANIGEGFVDAMKTISEYMHSIADDLRSIKEFFSGEKTFGQMLSEWFDIESIGSSIKYFSMIRDIMNFFSGKPNYDSNVSKFFGSIFGGNGFDTSFMATGVGVRRPNAGIDISLNQSADQVFAQFSSKWKSSPKQVSVDNSLKSTATSLFSSFKSSWLSGDRSVRIGNTLSTSASSAWGKFKSEWNSGDRRIAVRNELNKSGSTLWSEIKHGFGNPTLPIKASVNSQIRVKDLISSEAASLAIKNSATKQKIGTFTVARMARGGIISAETLFPGGVLAGEDGKEAIIPLERNTEWLDKLADRLLSKLSGASGGDGKPISVNVNVYLNDQVAGKSAVRYIRSEVKAGRDPLGAYI